MKNTLFEGCQEPRDKVVERLRRIIREELSQPQREVVVAYYFQNKRIPQIAREWGVNKSSVSRLLKRAEKSLQKYLKY